LLVAQLLEKVPWGPNVVAGHQGPDCSLCPRLLVGKHLMLRRTLCFLMASAILLAGLALAIAEIVRAEGMQPFLLVGAGLMIGAAGVWLADEVLRQRQENRRPQRGPSK
jgi:hypothetical protein